MLWCKVCQTEFYPKDLYREDEWNCPDCGNTAEDAFHAQGGGIVVWDSLQLQYKFVADPPTGFKLFDLMPIEWGIA